MLRVILVGARFTQPRPIADVADTELESEFELM